MAVPSSAIFIIVRKISDPEVAKFLAKVRISIIKVDETCLYVEPEQIVETCVYVEPEQIVESTTLEMKQKPQTPNLQEFQQEPYEDTTIEQKQLKEQLICVESELSQTKKEVQTLREQLQQTVTKQKLKQAKEETEKGSLMAKTAVLTQREPSQYATIKQEQDSSTLQHKRQESRLSDLQLEVLQEMVNIERKTLESPADRGTPTEFYTHVKGSSLSETKEAEKQKLLAQMEIQSQYEENWLVQLTAEVRELRASLVEAENGRMRAEMELEDLKSRTTQVLPVPQNCKAVGPGLEYGETNQISHFQVHLVDANGEPCAERQKVTAELKTQADGSLIQAVVSHQIRSVGSYDVSYQPSIRGRHELSVSVNGMSISGSPFRVYVQQPSHLMGWPKRVTRDIKRPWRSTMSRSGQLIVTERGRISIFDSQGGLVHRIDSLIERWYSKVRPNPTGIATDDSGMMYICDCDAHKLFKVSSTGKIVRSVGGRGNAPGQFDYPDGISLRDSKLYVCDRNNHRIQIFNCDLNFISSFGSYGGGKGEFSGPRDIAFDQDGNMYTVEESNHRVQVFSPSGTFLRTFGKHGSGSGELSEPHGIHVDHNIVYISECDNHCVSQFTTMGEFITSFGRWGSEEGEFFRPRGITMDQDGYLYVCDCDNNRIQMF